MERGWPSHHGRDHQLTTRTSDTYIDSVIITDDKDGTILPLIRERGTQKHP